MPGASAATSSRENGSSSQARRAFWSSRSRSTSPNWAHQRRVASSTSVTSRLTWSMRRSEITASPVLGALDAVEEVGAQALRLAHKLEPLHTLKHLLEGDADFQPRQMGAEAVMNTAGAEGHVLVR